MATFEATETSRKLMGTLGEAFQDLALKQSEEFIDAGQSIREATSIVASLMIKAAWIVAGSGACAKGVTPDKDKFRAAVEAVLDSIEFRNPEEDTGGRATSPTPEQ